ncbi:MAG: hypothetical protein Q9197_004546 [Variospora fuerteventurae]
MIRLLHAERRELPDEDEISGQQGLPYVIISHVWQRKEVLFEDGPNLRSWTESSPPPPSAKSGSVQKITGACKAVREYGDGRITHLWLDNVCIDKKNLTEFSMSINSMYQWYKRANVCFAYLEDYSDKFPTSDVPVFTRSKWFTRGWCLQEMLAPSKVIFFDKSWKAIGNKESLQTQLTARTHISKDFLLNKADISRASVSQRMSWFAGRETTVPEDTAYCLLGIFGVNMPLLYGEGKERAFRRLQEEIMRYSDDHTLFAWKSPSAREPGLPPETDLLASSQDYFKGTGDYVHNPNKQNNRPFQMTNKGVSIDLYLQQYQGGYIASIDCLHGQSHYLGIFLKCLSDANQQYRRTRTDELCKVMSSGRGQLRSIFVKPPADI